MLPGYWGAQMSIFAAVLRRAFLGTVLTAVLATASHATTYVFYDWSAALTNGIWKFTNASNPAGTISAQSVAGFWTPDTAYYGLPAAISSQTFTHEMDVSASNGIGDPFTITLPAGFAWGSGGMLVIGNVHDWFSYKLQAWDFNGLPINVNNWMTPAGLQAEYLTGGAGYFATSNTVSTALGNDRIFSVSDSSVTPGYGQGGVIPLLMTHAGLPDNVAKITVTLTNDAPPGGEGGGVDFVILNVATPVDQGVLKLCKVAGPGVAIGAPFAFKVGASTYSVPAGAPPGGSCVLGPSFAVGSTATVVETIPAGGSVSSITAAPTGRLMSSNLATGTATVSIGSGFTDLTYTNQLPTGYLEICKQIGPANIFPNAAGDYTFKLNGGSVGTVTVHSGACSPAIQVPAGLLTIQESPDAGTVMTGCSSIPASRQAVCVPSSRISRVGIVAGDVSTATVAIIANRALPWTNNSGDTGAAITVLQNSAPQRSDARAQSVPPSPSVMDCQRPANSAQGVPVGAMQNGKVVNCGADVRAGAAPH